MDEDLCNPAALLKRISELERERDELQLDIEQLCMQQSGMSSKADALSKIQTRRITTLKQELEVSKHKLEECTKKNCKLHEELTEIYNIKTQFADLLKSETDKNVELEKNIKFFQTTVASALIERDKAVLQVENRQKREKELTGKVKQLGDRLELLSSELQEHRKVVDFFWDIRMKESETKCQGEYHEKAMALLGDPQNFWTYGDRGKELESLYDQVKDGKIAMALLQEKYHASIDLVSSLTRDLKGVATAKKLVEDQYLDHKEKMVHLMVVLTGELRKFQSDFFYFKRDTMKTLKETAEWSGMFYRDFQIKQLKIHIVDNELSEKRDSIDKEKAAHGEVFKENHKDSRNAQEQVSDSQILGIKEALALALQQKVSTLLLLSQQEERRILEENTIAAQEYRIIQLQKQLFQVTADKANVLMELANLWEEFQRIQELHWVLPYSNYSRIVDHHNAQLRWSKVEGNGSSKVLGNTQMQSKNEGNVSPRWIWSKTLIPDSLKHFEAQDHDTRRVSTHWIQRYWLNDSGHNKSINTTRVQGGCGVARLQAENAALRDIFSILQELSGSVMRLHQRIAKIAQEPWDWHLDSFSHNISLLHSVIEEGKHLRLSFASGLCQNETNLAAPFGGALLDSILLAAEICKTYLNSREVI